MPPSASRFTENSRSLYSYAPVSGIGHSPSSSHTAINFFAFDKTIADKLEFVAPHPMALCMILWIASITNFVGEAELVRQFDLKFSPLNGEVDRAAACDNHS